MDGPGHQPARIHPVRLAWLDEQSARWQGQGIIDASARARIMAGYDAESAERRGMLALVAVGLLICGVGLSLLIGYNWNRIPAATKVAGLLGLVAAAFAASAYAYRTGRPGAAESLAFAGTLAFGNGIWLIAQVLHMQGHFPDAFLWWSIGALACAYLVRSSWAGVEAAVLLIVWVVAEGLTVPGMNFLFLALWPMTLFVAYRVESHVMLRIAAVAFAAWVTANDRETFGSPLWPGSVALAACGLYAAGLWEQTRIPMRMAWQSSALAVLLAALVPLMVLGVQEDLMRGAAAGSAGRLVLAAVLAAAVLSAAPRARTAADLAMAAAAAATMIWIVAVLLGARSPIASTVLFSAIALGMSVALIRTALTSGLLLDLVFGVLFALAFLFVRWASVVENMLWSGALMLATGGGLLLVARLWRSRNRHVPPAQPAAGGVS